MAGHERFEELAVGHVLGGLDDTAAAEFRSHLLGCRDCRLRVAELRDLASELAAAEREERAQARLKIEVERAAREDRDDFDDDEPAWRVSGRAIGVGLILLIGALIALAFWNLNLRQANEAMLRATEVRERTLARLSSGTVARTDMAQGVTGVVVTAGDDVAVGLSGLPQIAGTQTIMLWLIDAGAVDNEVTYEPDAVEDGLLATTLRHMDADTLLVTLENGHPPRPQGPVLVDADLRATAEATLTP